MPQLHTALLRLGLIASTSLAASRYIRAKAAPTEACPLSLMEPCKYVDANVLPQHALFPLGVVYAYLSVAYFPSLLLSSPERTQQLKTGLGRMLLLLVGVLSVWRWFPSHGALVYALQMHGALYYVSEGTEPYLLIGRYFDAVLRLTAASTILMYAWNFGPPLSVMSTPGVEGQCCASLAHLIAITLTELGLPLVLRGLDKMML